LEERNAYCVDEEEREQPPLSGDFIILDTNQVKRNDNFFEFNIHLRASVDKIAV